jgi:peptide/nickel transport system ATP-binding protein
MILARSPANLLEVSSLTVTSRDGVARVRDVSFAVEPGERLGLIGESGSGKSLTAFAIIGLLPAGLTATGSVLLDGTQVVGAPEKRLVPLRGRVCAFIFQEPLTALDPLMKLGRQLAEPIARHQGLRGADLRRAVIAALDEVSLPEPERIAESRSYEISGGQRQRVAIAMALACRPRLLIADEPTTALDVTVQAEVLALLDRLVAERGMALIFVSHDLAVISRMTDHAIVMRAGEAVERGSIASLLASPRHPYTAAFAASARRIEQGLVAALAQGRKP